MRLYLVVKTTVDLKNQDQWVRGQESRSGASSAQTLRMLDNDMDFYITSFWY